MSRILFTNSMIFDGTGAPSYPGEVLVDGNRIKAVASGTRKIAQEGANVVDGGGATLMPGLVEAHAHVSWPSAFDRIVDDMNLPPEENLLIAARNARILIDHGFTSAYSAGALGKRFEVALRNEIDGGWLPGPRLKASSLERAPTGTTGVPDAHDEEHGKGPEAIREFIKWAAAAGVDTVKFLLTSDDYFTPGGSQQIIYSEDEVRAAGEQARESGVWLAAHAHANEAVKMALRHGFRVLYHCTYADEEALDMLEARKAEIFMAPAIGIIKSTLETMGSPSPTAPFGPHRTMELAQKLVPELHRRGVRVLPGGDYGFPGNPMGRNARDIELFVELFGYSPIEALVAATKLGGEIMGMGKELGLIKEGYLADLLLVNGDPTKEVKLLQDRDNLRVIMKDGAYHKAPNAVTESRVAGG